MIFKNVISWFEIPATDLNRAQNFYERIFGMKMTSIDLENIKMRLFPVEEPMGVGGSLVDSGSFHKPSASEGPLLYLNANPDVQNVLNKVDEAGGKIIVPKKTKYHNLSYLFLGPTAGSKQRTAFCHQEKTQPPDLKIVRRKKQLQHHPIDWPSWFYAQLRLAHFEGPEPYNTCPCHRVKLPYLVRCILTTPAVKYEVNHHPQFVKRMPGLTIE